MKSIDVFILEIKAKREFLQHLIKNTNDKNVIQKISSSLSTYLQMERHLSQLGIFMDEDSKQLIKEQVYINKLFPYFIQSKSGLFNYLSQQLDLEYVNSLLDILANAYSFSIPSLNLDNHEIINLTKEFYLQTFHGSILKEAMYLLTDSYILFLDKVSNEFPIPILGRSYRDDYYQNVYSFIQKQHNIGDYSSLPHEIFHGLHFKLNPSSTKSIEEAQEVGSNMVELLYYDFLSKNFISNGDILKKIYLISISNEATILKRNLEINEESVDITHAFLLLEAKLVGYGMVQEFFANPKQGEQKLLQYIFHNFSMDSLPDYSSLGYSKSKILQIARQLVEERDVFLNSNYQKSL